LDEFNNQLRKLKETIEALTKELENMKSRDVSLLPAKNEFETKVTFATDDTQVKRATDGTQMKSVTSAAVQTEMQECNNESESKKSLTCSENEKRKNVDLEDMVKKLEESFRELNYQKESMLSKHADDSNLLREQVDALQKRLNKDSEVNFQDMEGKMKDMEGKIRTLTENLTNSNRSYSELQSLAADAEVCVFLVIAEVQFQSMSVIAQHH
jgi:hypothetical protein